MSDLADPFSYAPAQLPGTAPAAPGSPATAPAAPDHGADPFSYAPNQLSPQTQSVATPQETAPRVFTPMDLKTFDELKIAPEHAISFDEWKKQQDSPGANEGRGFWSAFTGIMKNVRDIPQNWRDMQWKPDAKYDTPAAREAATPYVRAMQIALGGDEYEASDNLQTVLKFGAFAQGTGKVIANNLRGLVNGLANTGAQKVNSLIPTSPEDDARMGHDEAVKTRGQLMQWMTDLTGMRDAVDAKQVFEDVGYGGKVKRTVMTKGSDGKDVPTQVEVNPAEQIAGVTAMAFDPTNLVTAGVAGTVFEGAGALMKSAAAARLSATALKAAQGVATFAEKVPYGAAVVTGMRATASAGADIGRGFILSPTGEIVTLAGRGLGAASTAAGNVLDKTATMITKPAVKWGLGTAYVAGAQLGGSDDSLFTSVGKAVAGTFLASKLATGMTYVTKSGVAADILKAAGGFAKLPTQEAALALANGTAATLPGLAENVVTNATAKSIAAWTASTGLPASAARLLGRNMAQGSDTLLHGIMMGGAFGYATHGDAQGFMEGAGNGFGLAAILGLGNQVRGETLGRVYLDPKTLPSVTTAVRAMTENGIVPTGGLGIVLGDSPGGIKAKQSMASQWLQSKTPSEQALFTRTDADGKSELSWQDHYQAAFVDLALRGAKGADGQDFDVRWLNNADYKSHMQQLDTYVDPKTGSPVRFSPAESQQRAEAAPWVTVTDGSTGRPVVLLNMEAHGAAMGIDRAFHEAYHAMSAMRGPGAEQAKALKALEGQFATNYGPNWTRATISDGDRLQHAALSGDPMGQALARFHNAMFGDGGQFSSDSAKGDLYTQYKTALGLQPDQFPAWDTLSPAVKGSLSPLLGSALGTVYAEGGAEAFAGLMRKSGTNPLDFLSRAANGTPISTASGTVYYHGAKLGTIERGLRSLGITIDGLNAGAALGNNGSVIFRGPDGKPLSAGSAAERYVARFAEEKLSHLDRMRTVDSYDEATNPIVETKLPDLAANPERAREVSTTGLIDEEHFRQTTAAAVAKAQADENARAKAANEAPKVIQPEEVPVPPEAIKPGTPEKAAAQEKARDLTVRKALTNVPQSPADPRAVHIDPETGRFRGYYLDPAQLDAVQAANDPAWNDSHKGLVQVLNEAMWQSYDPGRAGPPAGPLQVTYHPAMQPGRNGQYKYASLNTKTYLVQPFGFKEHSDGQWTAQMFDVAGHESAMAGEFGKGESTYKDIFGTVDNMRGKTQQVLANYRQDQPGATNGVTTKERDAVNAFMGFNTKEIAKVNPSSIPSQPNKYIRSMRIDRIANILPTEGLPMPVDYRYTAQNFSPAASFLRDAEGMAADRAEQLKLLQPQATSNKNVADAEKPSYLIDNEPPKAPAQKDASGSDAQRGSELPDSAGGRRFHSAIAAAASTHRFGFAVEVKDAEFYDNPANKLFLTPGGSAGAAVTDYGDLVSVFKKYKSDGDIDGILHQASQHAHTLDGFDIGGKLPDLYAKYGFRPAARVPFNDEFAPPGWNYADAGRPDVVLMVRDLNGTSGLPPLVSGDYHIVKQHVPLVDYDTAAAMQQAAKQRMLHADRTATPAGAK